MKEQEALKNLYKELLASEQIVFPEKGKINVNKSHGVYIIYSPRNKVLYVGRTNRAKNGLNQRLNNHLYKYFTFSKLYLKLKNISLRNKYRFRYLVVKNPKKRTLLEALTAGLLCPAHIGTGENKINKNGNTIQRSKL